MFYASTGCYTNKTLKSVCLILNDLMFEPEHAPLSPGNVSVFPRHVYNNTSRKKPEMYFINPCSLPTKYADWSPKTPWKSGTCRRNVQLPIATELLKHGQKKKQPQSACTFPLWLSFISIHSPTLIPLLCVCGFGQAKTKGTLATVSAPSEKPKPDLPECRFLTVCNDLFWCTGYH